MNKKYHILFEGKVAFEVFSNQKMSHSLSLSLLALFMIMSQLVISNAFLNRYTVHVINGLKNETLQAHCKSKDDDIGLHQIDVNEQFQWSFRVNFWDSTLFWCTMWWTGGQRLIEVFPTDDNKFLYTDCGDKNCRWMGKEDGIYSFNTDHKEYRLKFTWEP